MKKSNLFDNTTPLYIVPLLLFTIISLVQTDQLFAQKMDARDRILNGRNSITYTDILDDTTFVQDPATGEQQIILSSYTYQPTKLNGIDIYYKSTNAKKRPIVLSKTINVL